MLTKKIRILISQKNPIRFLVSRILRDLGLLDRYQLFYSYKDIKLRLSRSALSLALWIDKNDRDDDSMIISSILEHGDVFVDVGAHIGHLSLLAARKVGPAGKVFSFEAHPKTYQDLVDNIKVNKINNIFASNIAVADKLAWLGFSDEPRANDQNCVKLDADLKILAVPLDLVLPAKRVKLLKIDVEGFEKFVFEGGRTILNLVDAVYFEAYEKNYDKYDTKFSEIYDLLFSYGFSLGVVDSHGYITRLSRDFKPYNCVNILGWRDEGKIIDSLFSISSG